MPQFQEMTRRRAIEGPKILFFLVLRKEASLAAPNPVGRNQRGDSTWYH